MVLIIKSSHLERRILMYPTPQPMPVRQEVSPIVEEEKRPALGIWRIPGYSYSVTTVLAKDIAPDIDFYHTSLKVYDCNLEKIVNIAIPKECGDILANLYKYALKVTLVFTFEGDYITLARISELKG